MDRDRIVAALKAHERDIRARGAKALYLFGSVQRDEARADSDVDLFIDYEETSGFSLIELAGLQAEVARFLGRKVDLTTRNSLHPLLRDEIVRSAERVF